MPIKNPLPRSTPEAQGISSSSIHNFIDAIEEKKLELHSFMFLRHGHVVSEGWWHPYNPDLPHMLFSLSKSFTSTAIGFAVEEGLLSVEDTVTNFFPEDTPEKTSEFLAAMKVKHLLSMSTGHAEDTSGRVFGNEDGNWVKSFLAIEVDFEPGTHFVYNTAATYMLSAIIQKLTGKTLLEYLTPRLFEPLGIESATWETCPRGINTGGFGLSVKTEDIAKFGQLYLKEGVWNGKQIISSSWIKEATTSHISNGTDPLSDWQQGYCYQFWRCQNNAYRGDGAFGQYCVVMSDQDAVIAITSGINDMQSVLNYIWEHLLPAMLPSSLPEDPEQHAKLETKLKNLLLPTQSGFVAGNKSDNIFNKSFKMQDNDLRIESLSFDFKDNLCTFTAGTPVGNQPIDCGYEEYIEETADLTGSPSKIMACGNWTGEDTFNILLRLVETPFCYNLACRFDGDDIEVKVTTNVSFGPKEFPLLKGQLIN